MDVLDKVYNFYKEYDGEKFVIGKSVLNRDVLCVKCGYKGPKIIVQCAIHAREWITSLLALKLISNFSSDCIVYFIPVANPDGVALSLKGLRSVNEKSRKDFLKNINGSDDFSLWKANADGVDLNVNFNAKWGEGIKNVFEPSSENYVGSRFESEPETQALVNFTRFIKPVATLSFHTKGEEIYWYFNQNEKNSRRDLKIAKALAVATGYKIKCISGSVGGYKDWCISELKIPAFTVEVGGDNLSHPITEKYIDDIYDKNKYIINTLSKELYGK